MSQNLKFQNHTRTAYTPEYQAEAVQAWHG